MMGRRTFGGVLLAGLAAAVSGCGSRASYRFGVTVEVATPQGKKTGSSVMEVIASTGDIRIGDMSGKGGGVRGEAVIVDLPNGPLFMLLQLPDASGNIGGSATYALRGLKKSDSVEYIDEVRTLGGWRADYKAELPRAAWPMMVRFRDINDPKSVERVDPVQLGVTRIMLETTGDAVTTGIQKRLGWFADYRDRFFDGSSTASEDLVSTSMSAHLTSRSFSTEAFK